MTLNDGPFTRMQSRRACLLAFALLCANFVEWPRVRAQSFDGSGPLQNLEGFTVAGKGAVMAKPDLVEIDLDISASSELTADAIVKYRDSKRRLHDAFVALKLANVALGERGLLVEQKGMQQSPYFFDSMPNSRSKTEVQLSRKLVVQATDIRKMDEEAVLQLVAKLIDVAQDAGAHVGPQNNNGWYSYRFGGSANGLVRFVLEDLETAQEKAYDKAINDARARAERLARLSKVELGPIIAVRELVVPGEGGSSGGGMSYNPYFGMVPDTSKDEENGLKKRIETSKYEAIPVRVELMVRFAVRSKADDKTKAGEPGR